MIDSSHFLPASRLNSTTFKKIFPDRVTFDPFYPGKITKQTEKKTDRKTKQQQEF